jgi:hypothetical protein
MPAEDDEVAKHHRHRHLLFASADDTFKAAVTAFNLDANGNQDVVTLASTLADSVIICKIGDASVAAPHDKASVLAYLTTPAPGLKGCKFAPKNDKMASSTKVHGTAKWVDNDGTSNDTLKYDFDFDPDTHLVTKFFAGDK